MAAFEFRSPYFLSITFLLLLLLLLLSFSPFNQFHFTPLNPYSSRSAPLQIRNYTISYQYATPNPAPSPSPSPSTVADNLQVTTFTFSCFWRFSFYEIIRIKFQSFFISGFFFIFSSILLSLS